MIDTNLQVISVLFSLFYSKLMLKPVVYIDISSVPVLCFIK